MFQSLMLVLAMAGFTMSLQDRDNPALLGVVALDADPGLRLVEIIPGSAAEQAGLVAGDLLLSLDDKKLDDPHHLDRVLLAHKPNDELAFSVRHGKDPVRDGTLILGARSALKATQLVNHKRGQVGFKAPAWYAWSWSNLEKKQAPPSLEDCAGKVVVIHSFQSW